MTPLARQTARMPRWAWTVIACGLAWNLFGLFQLVQTLQQTEQTGMMSGMSAEAARVYYNLPAWMSLAFALGAGGGALGCLAMAFRWSAALPILALSAAGYGTLFLGDWLHGLFDLLPNQLGVLLAVLAIAAGLLATAGALRRGGVLPHSH